MNKPNFSLPAHILNAKIHNKQSLFPPDFSMLGKGRCPVCFTKLYKLLKKEGYSYCKSKKHKGSKVWKI